MEISKMACHDRGSLPTVKYLIFYILFFISYFLFLIFYFLFLPYFLSSWVFVVVVVLVLVVEWVAEDFGSATNDLRPSHLSGIWHGGNPGVTSSRPRLLFHVESALY
jgi:hypothetical protein